MFGWLYNVAKTSSHVLVGHIVVKNESTCFGWLYKVAKTSSQRVLVGYIMWRKTSSQRVWWLYKVAKNR